MKKMMMVLAATSVMTAPVLGENFDLSFKGGTVKEYYTALQATAPGIRLVVHPDVDLFMMPAVELPDMTEWGAVRVAAELIDGVEAEYIPTEGAPSPWEGATFVVTAQRNAVADELSVLRTVDIDFDGGSLGSLVEKLREYSDANIVVDPLADGVPLPPMKLRKADVHNVMMTLAGRQPIGFEDGAWIDVHWIKAGASENYLYFVSLKRPSDSVHRNTVLRYWSLGHVIESSELEAADVLGAIEAARPFMFDDFEMSYHEPTRVLILKGAQVDLNSIDKLLDSVTESAHSMEQRR